MTSDNGNNQKKRQRLAVSYPQKNHVDPKSKTFPSEYLARCWAEADEESAAYKNDSNSDESTEINHGF